MDYIKNRFKEASTWHGIFWMLAAFGVYTFTPEQILAITALGMSLAGSTAAIVLPDNMLKRKNK